MSVTSMQVASHKLWQMHVPVIPRLITRLMRFVYGCSIPCTAEIDSTATFAHKAQGVVLGHDVVIGAGNKILQNVTLGGRGGNTRDGRSGPAIGRDVLVGAGACVLGPVIVHDGAKIGANAVVLHDIPAGATAVGVPARIIPARPETEGEDER